MDNGLRIFIGCLVACPSAYYTARLSFSLPLDPADAALTAGLFSLVVFTSIVCWSARAYKLLSFGINVFVPASVLTTAMLLLRHN